MPTRIHGSDRKLQPTFIRQWRQSHRMSQDDLVGEMLEVVGTFSKATLSRLETGKQPYTQETLEALAVCLKCRPADLLMRNPLDGSAIWTLIDAVQQTSPQTQKQIQAVVEAIIKTSSDLEH